jgi:molybdopterin converting factor subunit 1
MTVTVLLFASYADLLGARSIDIELPSGATVRHLVERLAAFPGADRLPPKPLVAVNQSYAADARVLQPGDEIAVIPPVAGG